MTSSGHAHRSFNKITENWVTEVDVTMIWWYTVAKFHFWNTTKLWLFTIWFQKMSFLSQKAVSISESGFYFQIYVASVCHHP